VTVGFSWVLSTGVERENKICGLFLFFDNHKKFVGPLFAGHKKSNRVGGVEGNAGFALTVGPPSIFCFNKIIGGGGNK
jgi:hypothetical protein